MNRFVEFAGAVVAVLLADPVAKLAFGFRQGECILIEHHIHIVFGSYLVNEQVIVTTGYVVDAGKTFLAEEQFAFVRQVSTHTHIWHTRKAHTTCIAGQNGMFQSE